MRCVFCGRDITDSFHHGLQAAAIDAHLRDVGDVEVCPPDACPDLFNRRQGRRRGVLGVA